MKLPFSAIPVILSASVLVTTCSFLNAQQSVSGADSSASAAIPDAPEPQLALASIADPQSGPASDPAQNAQPPAKETTPASSAAEQAGSSSQPQPDDQAIRRQKSQQELEEEEHQRVLGVVPTFNITYRHDAAPLTAGQKLNLAFHSSVDPFTFGAAFLAAGYREALDQDTGFGWGPEGYFKRSGAAYLDAFNGTMIGNGFLPAILRQDPRYFRLGPGPSTTHRILYAAMTTFVCKGDNGRWQPNVSNVGGNVIAGYISNYYYPSQNSGWSQTIDNGMVVTTEGAIGGLFDEFWPDISRKLFHNDPTHGLDAQQEIENRKRAAANNGPIRK